MLSIGMGAGYIRFERPMPQVKLQLRLYCHLPLADPPLVSLSGLGVRAPCTVERCHEVVNRDFSISTAARCPFAQSLLKTKACALPLLPLPASYHTGRDGGG